MPSQTDTAAKLNGSMPSPVNPAALPEHYEWLDALQAMRVGDFSVRMPGSHVGLAGKIADTFNEIVAANERMAQQLERVGQVVGRDGKIRQRVEFSLSGGAWREMENSVNTLIDEPPKSPVRSRRSPRGTCSRRFD
jgi:hypothetical protein